MELFHNSDTNNLKYTLTGPYTNLLQKVKKKILWTKSFSNLLKPQTCKIKHNSQRKELVNVRNVAKYISTGCCFNIWQIAKLHELELTYEFKDRTKSNIQPEAT